MLTLHPPQQEYICKSHLRRLRLGCGLQDTTTTDTGLLDTGPSAGLNLACYALTRVDMLGIRQRSRNREHTVNSANVDADKIILDKAP